MNKVTTLKKITDVWKTTQGEMNEMLPLQLIVEHLDLPLDFLTDSETLSPMYYDIDYVYNHSYSKAISPMVEKLCNEDGELSFQGKIALCKHIYQCFADKWNRLWETIHTSYNALENYDRIEDSTITASGTGTDVMTGKQKNTQLLGDVTDEVTVSAFDSTNYQPSNKTKTHVDGSNTSETEYQNVTNTKSDSNTTTTNSRIHGNIGVTTSTQMLASEWLERQKINYRDMVYADMDSILTMPIYVGE